MVVRGGGVEDVRFRTLDTDIIVVELFVNV